MIDHDLIDWRVSNTWEKNGVKWGMLVAYIDARTAMEELDRLDAGWSTDMQPVTLGADQGIRCALTVNGVTRVDVGVPSNTEPLKGAFSDALKRAAVQFGVGRELYEMPKIAVECEVVNGKVRGPKALPTFIKGRWTIDKKYGWVKYDREPMTKPEQGEAGTSGGAERALPAAKAAPVPAPAHPSTDQVAARYGFAREKGWTDDALDDAATDSVGKTPMVMDSDEWRLFATAVVKHGPTESTAVPTSEALTPDAAVTEAAGETPPSSAASEPPQPGTDEYRALTPLEKSKARAHWSNGASPQTVDAPEVIEPMEMAL